MNRNNGKRLAVMISGSGTILEAMIRQKLPINLVIADRECRGLEIAVKNNIKTKLIDRKIYGWNPKQPQFFKRDKFSIEIADILKKYEISLVAMAGFMTVLDRCFFDLYKGLIINTHPALLPSFPGAHAVRDAINFGVKISGCTVHLATEKVDYGRILAQEAVRILQEDTEESLQEKIKIKERKLYPKILKEMLGLD